MRPYCLRRTRAVSLSATAALVLSVFSLNALPAAASTPPILITFDDFPTQPVDGFAHPAGVTFGFTIDGVADLDADYGSFGPGLITFVDDPSIEGAAAGVLALDFDLPTTLLEFGVAINTPMTQVVDAVDVQLFGPSGALVLSESLTLDPFAFFPEAQFVYSGAPIQSATIDFSPSPAMRFAFDNLAFRPVPEPASLALPAAVVFANAGRRRRRSQVA